MDGVGGRAGLRTWIGEASTLVRLGYVVSTLKASPGSGVFPSLGNQTLPRLLGDVGLWRKVRHRILPEVMKNKIVGLPWWRSG